MRGGKREGAGPSFQVLRLTMAQAIQLLFDLKDWRYGEKFPDAGELNWKLRKLSDTSKKELSEQIRGFWD